MFFSISFTTSFSLVFSSARGSILLISCYRCTVVHAIPYKSTKIMKNFNLQTSKMDITEAILTLIYFMAMERVDFSLLTSLVVSSSSTTTTSSPRLWRIRMA